MMHHFMVPYLSDGLGALMVVLGVALFVCCVVAYCLAIYALVVAGRAKEIQLGDAALWFLGIMLTPLGLGLIVLATPDRGRKCCCHKHHHGHHDHGERCHKHRDDEPPADPAAPAAE